MKKKLFQILMLLVATVSVGSFVSCKDTNEDLYNELRTQVISRDASLQSALDQHTQDIADLLAKYQSLLATVNAINSCTCNEAAMQGQINGLGTDVATLQGDVQTLKGQVATLTSDLSGLDIDDISGLRTALNTLENAISGKASATDLAWLSGKYNAEIPIIQGIISNLQTALAGKADQATLDAVNQTLGALTQQIQGIQNGLTTLQNQDLLTTINANKAALETRIASLESTLKSLLEAPDGKDILTRLGKAEQAIIDNKAWLDNELNRINGDITAAQTTADNALNLASEANTNAHLAWQNAQRVEGLANAAQAAADNAQGDATAAQQAAQAAQNAADLAYALAARAYETANQVNALAIKVATLEGQVGANDEAIKALQQQTQTLSSQISENKDKLQEAINKVNNDLTTKVNDLQSEIQTKMGELKDAFQGKIDNLDGKLETKISEVTSKITELNNTLIQNAGDIAQNAKDIAQNTKDIQANAAAIEKIKSDLQTMDTNLTLASEKANQAYQEAVNANTKAEANAQSISDLKATVDVNKANIETLQGSTNELKNAVDELKEKMAQVGANTTAIENLSNAVDGINDDLDALDEKYDNLKDQLSSLRTELNEAKAECANNFREAKNYVDTQIATLEAAVIQKIADELNNYYDKDDINKILEGYAKASDVATLNDLNNLRDELKNLATKSDLNNVLDKLNGLVSQEELNNLKEDLKDVASKSDLDNLKNEILAQLSGIATQNDLDRVKSELQSDINGLQGDLSKLSTDFYDKIIQLYKDVDAGDKAIDDKIYELAQQVAANTQHLDDIDKVLQTMHERFNDMDARFVNRETIMAWLQNLYKTLNAKIAAGGGAEINIQVLKDEIKDDLVELLPDIITNTLEGSEFNFITEDDLADYAKKSDLDDYAKKSALDALEEALTDLINGKVGADEFAEAVEDIAEQEARILALEEGTVKIGDYEVDKQALTDAITDVDTKIGTVQDAVTAINEQLPTMQNDIRDLKTGLQEAKDRLAAVEPKVEALTNDVTKIQSYLAQQITGITIQGTTNPMFGTFSIPANIQSNVLVAYYGRPDNRIEFPTTDDASYVRKDEVLTDKDWEMIGGDDIAFIQKAKKVLINEATNGKAYAGKVYVTVNPTSADVAGLQLNIVNTQDEASLFKLTELKKSYDKLEFGYSRADNGFYEAEAYVEKKDLDDVERPFNEQAIKDLAKEAKNDLEQIMKNALTPGNTGLDNLATKVYEVVRTLRLDRSGVKCPFKDVNGNDQAVYSQYNLAATALKPLSLEWGKSFNYKTVYGYEKAEKMLKKLCDKLTGVVTSIEGNKEISKLFRDLEGLNITHVTLNELNDAYLAQFAVEISTSFTIDDVRYDLVLPVNVWVPVKYAKNLTIDGTRLNVDEAERVDLDYFNDNLAVNEKNTLFNKVKEQVTKPTVVITEDDATGSVTSVLVVPVNDQAGTIQGFTKFPLATPVAVVSGEIQFDGNGIAMVSGSNVVTAGYTQTVNIDQLNYSFLFNGKTFTYYKKVDFSDAIKDLWENQVGEAIGDVNDILDQLNELIDDALKLRELMVTYEGKYTNLVNSYLGVDGKLHDYLDKINSIIVNFVNGINWQLGPYIVADDVKGFKVLSVEKSMPTVMSKRDLKLYPTSKNMEIFCPFARKHVAVTNVFKGAASAQAGDADCLAKLKAANTGDMNKVIDGTQRMIEVNGVVSGYTYEIAYSVLDFEGNISTRKTYIKIK